MGLFSRKKKLQKEGLSEDTFELNETEDSEFEDVEDIEDFGSHTEDTTGSKKSLPLPEPKFDDAHLSLDFEGDLIVIREGEEVEARIKKMPLLLEQCAEIFKIDDPKIVHKENDSAFELRFKKNERAIRIISSYAYPPDITIEFKRNKVIPGWLDLYWDVETKETVKDNDPDWADDEEAIVLFVYKDIFFNTTEETIEFGLNILKQIPDEIKHNVYNLMPYLPVSNLELNIPSEKTLKVEFEKSMINDADYVNKINATIIYIGNFLDYFENEVNASESEVFESEVLFSTRVTCSYCSSVYIPGLTFNCPNCGANNQ